MFIRQSSLNNCKGFNDHGEDHIVSIYVSFLHNYEVCRLEEGTVR